MKATNECVYCYLKQAINCMEHGNIKESDQYEVLYELMDLIKTFDVNKSPAFNSTISILKTYELINNEDPFKEQKIISNHNAKKLLPNINQYIDESEDRLMAALHASSAGNIIDMGIYKEYNIEKTLLDTMKSEFSVNHYDLFTKKLKDTTDILIIGDNCGEIIFDYPVVNILNQMGKNVYYAVKSGPILNDALYEDAIFANIDEYATIIETGSNDLGVNFNNTSKIFNETFNKCDLVIAKGQANFESLDDFKEGFEKIYFLLKIKCEKVANIVEHSKYGDSVFFTRLENN